MPKKRNDSRSDDHDSSSDSSKGESSESSASKKSDHKRSRRESVSKHPPSRDMKYTEHRHHKGYSNVQRQASSSRHHSSESSRRHNFSDSSRRQSPFQEMRRADEKSETRNRGERDRRDQSSGNRRTDRDMNRRRVDENEDRYERRHRSRDKETEKSRKIEDKRSTSHSSDKKRSKDGKEDENYSSQQPEEKDKDTRRIRNDDKDNKLLNPTQKSSKDSLKEKEEARGGLSNDNSKVSDRSHRDDKRVVPEAKKSMQNEKVILRERKKKNSDSSSSSASSSESDSDIVSPNASGNRGKNKSTKASKDSTIAHLRQPETAERVSHAGNSEKEKLAGMDKKVDNPKEAVVERSHESSGSGSDSSGDERGSTISKKKQVHNQSNENSKKEAKTDLNTEDVSKAVVSGKQHSVSQEKILNDKRDVNSEEEKEEGEISEDNEDRVPDKPLKAISNYVSDKSSDDGQPEATETKEVQQQRTTPFLKTAPMVSRISSDITKRSEENVEHRSKSSKVGKTEKKIVAAANEDVPDLGNGSGKTRKKGKEFSDSEVVEGEDYSKRQRPVLESESDDESNDRDALKSSDRRHNQNKIKMGSSVSVVKLQSERRDRDRSPNRDGSRRRAGEESHSRDKRGTRSRYDTDKEKREGNRETKGLLDKSEQKTTSDSKSGKPDTSDAPKTTEDSGKKPVTAVDITTRTGGAYIPPAKLRMMQELITDKTSVPYQRMSWEALKKSINGLVNKVNVSNIINIIKELFQENIVRGRGLLARSVIQAQAASLTFTHVYAALVAIINTKFPQNGELILRRLILMFRRGFKRNDKAMCLSTTTFIAHLVNQQVAHEVLALEILTLLLENPTDDSVEIAVGFLKECGHKLTEVSPRGINSIFERLRNILHEGLLDVRVQYMVEVMFAIRKDGFKDHQSVLGELDLVEEDEQFTHLLQLEDAVAGDEMLNVFKADPDFAENEEKYKSLKKEILDEGSSEEGSDGESGSESSENDSDDEEKKNAEKQTIIDKTETNLIALRRTIYLTIQSSLDHNECAHKILKMDMKPGQEVELCNMILDCCAQLRTYEKFFGLLAQRFCQIDKKYIEPFQQIFLDQYETIHRLETNKLRNVAKFFSHLLHTDAISWGVLSVIKLTEEDTNSSSRIFLKILFQDLSEYMGLLKLNERLKDPTLSPYFTGILAKDNPKNTRFCINFFTTVGLGGLTDDLRDHLKSTAKQIAQQDLEADQLAKEDSSSSDSSLDSSDSDTSSDSGSDSPSKRKGKSSASRKKSEKETSKSKKKGTDKENKRESRISKKSSDRESKSTSSKSSGKLDRNERNGSPDKSRRTIADRLLDMAEYGNIRNGDERSKERNEKSKERSEGDRLDREKEVRPSLNRRDADEGRKGGRDDREYVDKNVRNAEMWGQSGKRWNSNDERGDRRQEEYMGRGKRSGEDRGQRIEDERRSGGRQNDVQNLRRREDQQNDSSFERLDLGSGNNRRFGNEYTRETLRQDKVNDAHRGRLSPRGEKRKNRRHDSSNEDSDSSPDNRKKKSDRRRNTSSSPERRNKRQSLEVESVPKQGRKKNQARYEASDVDSSSDSTNDKRSKLLKSQKDGKEIQASKSRSSDLSQTKKRKKSVSSSGSHTSSSSSSASSDEEAVQERRIITKKPRLVGDKNIKQQDVLEERSSDKDRVRRRK